MVEKAHHWSLGNYKKICTTVDQTGLCIITEVNVSRKTTHQPNNTANRMCFSSMQPRFRGREKLSGFTRPLTWSSMDSVNLRFLPTISVSPFFNVSPFAKATMSSTALDTSSLFSLLVIFAGRFSPRTRTEFHGVEERVKNIFEGATHAENINFLPLPCLSKSSLQHSFWCSCLQTTLHSESPSGALPRVLKVYPIQGEVWWWSQVGLVDPVNFANRSDGEGSDRIFRDLR